MKRVLTLTLVALLGGISALGLQQLFFKQPELSIAERQNAIFANYKGATIGAGLDFTMASSLVTPAVVHIKTTSNPTKHRGGDDGMDFFRNHGFQFELPDAGPQEASGSGVIISDNGYIVTNNHVIDGADKIEVILNDKRSYIADLIGSDPNYDLALLKIEEKNLPVVPFGNSENIKVGEWVLAVGNPFNLTSTVTAGIISAKGRNIRLLEGDAPIESFIQTDAAVNPGNSGGALVDQSGKLIGINTAIASQTGSYAGYSFAIPIDIVKKVIEDLEKYGEVQRGFLGVQIRDVDAQLAEQENLKEIKGVYVAEVNDNSGAEDAGIKQGDVILKVNELEVNSVPELQEQVSRFRPGDKINLLVRRGSSEKVYPVTLKSKTGKTTLTTKDSSPEKIMLAGTELRNITKEEKIKAKVNSGVVVVKTGASFRKAGVPEDFVITTIDKKPVYSALEVKKLFENQKDVILVGGVNPDGTKGYYPIVP